MISATRRSEGATRWMAALALALSACVVEGYGSDDAATTCGNYADFLYDCTASCQPTFDCPASYGDLYPSEQRALDACSDCLVSNLDAGYCSDCSIPSLGIQSCHAFMNDFLGVACF